MNHMVFILFPLISTFSNAEEFLKCSAVGRTNDKCFKDFYPDQEAQETNVFNTYEDEYHNEAFQRESSPPTLHFSHQDHYIQGQEYDYGYSVNDVSTGDQKSHRESRYDNVVHGTYSLIEPDGSKRTVVYTADDINGFNAVVYRDQANTFNYRDDSNTENYIGIRNMETFTRGSSNENIHNVDSDTIPTPFVETGSPRIENYESSLIDSFGNVLNSPNQHQSNLPPILFNPNLSPNPSIYNSNGQLSQNIPISINALESILGEQTVVNALNEEVNFTPDPMLRTSLQDHITLATDVQEKYSENHNTQISSTTLNPIIVQLNSEKVENLNSDLIRKNIPVNGNQEKAEFNSTQESSKGNFVSEQNIPNNSKIYPTSLPQLISTTHNSSSREESSISNSLATVESPYLSVVTTPVPITANVIPSRFNTLTDGEFPLLAHISPSYARRYARHYS